MNRISERLLRKREDPQKGFIPFITAGDPDIAASLQIALKLAELGADVIELGVPFSDPMADGPTIQLSSQRALQNGTAMSDVLELVRLFRRRSDVPIVLFSYLNPLLTYGIGRLARDGRAAGIDGVLVTDVVDRESAEIAKILATKQLILISLIAPTTSEERLSQIARTASGFLYAVSRAGVTGAKGDVSAEAEKLVRRARRYTDIPVAVGFGISTTSQIADVWQYADAAVVGSAIVSQIANSRPGAEAATVEDFVGSLLPKFAKTGAEP